jgi:hypothetical protein
MTICKSVHAEVGQSGALRGTDVILEQGCSFLRSQNPLSTSRNLQLWFEEHVGGNFFLVV